MSESLNHKYFVLKLREYVISEYMGIEECMIETDNPEWVCGRVPDLHYYWKEKLIIGEAKTETDVENPHSISQYYSYLKRCEWHCKSGEKAIFLLAIPGEVEARAINLINKIKREMNITCTEVVYITEYTFAGDKSNAEN